MRLSGRILSVRKQFLLIVFFLWPVALFAANDQTKTSSTTLVKITVVNACLLNNVSSGTAALGTLNFGSVYKLNSQLDYATTIGNGSIELRCTPGTTAKITLNAGLYGGSVNTRKMRSTLGVATLNYQLYTSSTRQTVWDDTVGLSVSFSDDLTKTFPVYGSIFAQPTPVSGQYNDQVVVTVTY